MSQFCAIPFINSLKRLGWAESNGFLKGNFKSPNHYHKEDNKECLYSRLNLVLFHLLKNCLFLTVS